MNSTTSSLTMNRMQPINLHHRPPATRSAVVCVFSPESFALAQMAMNQLPAPRRIRHEPSQPLSPLRSSMTAGRSPFTESVPIAQLDTNAEPVPSFWEFLGSLFQPAPVEEWCVLYMNCPSCHDRNCNRDHVTADMPSGLFTALGISIQSWALVEQMCEHVCRLIILVVSSKSGCICKTTCPR